MFEILQTRGLAARGNGFCNQHFGKPFIPSATFCNQNKGERPGYRMGLYNDINWCMANSDNGYHCTVSLVVGLAE